MPTILVLKPVYKDSSATCVLFLFLLCYTVCPKGPIASTSFLSFYNASLTINKKKKKSVPRGTHGLGLVGVGGFPPTLMPISVCITSLRAWPFCPPYRVYGVLLDFFFVSRSS